MSKYFFIIVLILFTITVILADTYYVDEDYPVETTYNKKTIQTAIDAATSTDEIIVYEADDGYYDEELEIYWKNLTLRCAEDSEVNIRGQNGITIDIAYTNSDVVIDGFNLQNTDNNETVIRVQADSSPELTVQNCSFNNSNWHMIDIYEAGYIHLYDNSFRRLNSGSENLVRIQESATEIDISGNIFENTTSAGINVANSDNVFIHHNEFTNCSTCIHYNNTLYSGEIVIYRNLIYESTSSYADAAMILQGYSSCSIYNNTFVSNASLPLPALLDCNNDNDTVIEKFHSNIMQGYDNFVECSVSNFDVGVEYCCYDGNLLIGIDAGHNITDDPEFVDPDNDDYHLQYYSPCIDRGDRSSIFDDEDGSMADMGYACHDQYKYEWVSGIFSQQWKWLSFPKLPVPSNDQYNEGDFVNTDTLRWHWNDIPDSCAWYYHGGSASPWFYGLDEDSDEFFDYWSSGEPCTDSLTSLKGYKIFRPEGGCDLFTRGKECELDETVTAYQGIDSWLGYFIPETQSAEDALPSGVLDDCLKIQTQRWCTSRAATGDPWSKDPGDCYINYADCVILHTMRQHIFSWNRNRNLTEPIIRPYAEHFEWEEEIDYLPVYVEFDPEDVPDEIGIFVDDICQGAEVVEGLNCQICSYILFEDPGQEIEFEFWYEGRGERARRDSYQIHENGYPVLSNTLFTGQPGEFYTLSFNKGESVEPVPYNICCYPNPFNPETTISFELDKEVDVELVVYNIKGQKIRTLVNEIFRPDTYSITWNGDNNKGNKVSSGVYFIKLIIDNEILTNKVILLK